MLIIARSILFAGLFHLNLAVHLIAALPTLAMPRRRVMTIAKSWSRANAWLLRVVCGTGETMETFAPHRALTRVDFPDDGRPTTATTADFTAQLGNLRRTSANWSFRPWKISTSTGSKWLPA